MSTLYDLLSMYNRILDDKADRLSMRPISRGPLFFTLQGTINSARLIMAYNAEISSRPSTP